MRHRSAGERAPELAAETEPSSNYLLTLLIQREIGGKIAFPSLSASALRPAVQRTIAFHLNGENNCFIGWLRVSSRAVIGVESPQIR